MEIKNIKGEVLRNEPLSRHTSFGIGGPADLLVYPADTADLVALLREIRAQELPFIVLGGGTNLLVRDGGFRGVAIGLRRLNAVKVEREYRSLGGTYAVVSAEAGAVLAKVISFAANEALTGLEFATGIPGTIGGAVCMNAGTAEGEMGDVVETVTLLTPGGELATRSKEEMGFGYRTANVPAGHVVLSARLQLRHDEKKKIEAKVKVLMEKRKDRQPWGQPNAGSIFKNPLDESAGKLIESAGLKGKAVGGAQVSEKHANFIVNTGKATAADVLSLMEIMKQTVLEVHGARLEPEIKIIGEDA
jgi:UDP-N-acetylmuramate dehydrogenase